MAKVYRVNKKKVLIECPACGYAHIIDGRWNFNNDFKKPTFKPSLLVEGKYRCHSFITDGKIKFLNDCNHNMAGEIVELPNINSKEWE